MIVILNLILLHGCLVTNPTLGETPAGVKYANFPLAVERDYRAADGQRITDFFDCTAWKSNAEFIANHFRKGQGAVIRGKMESRKWVDKDGNKRLSWNVIVDTIDFSVGKREGGKDEKPDAMKSNEMQDDEQIPF